MVELKDVAMDHYNPQMWLDELVPYLKQVIGMNDNQVNNEIEKRFPDLWEAHKSSIGLLL